MNAKKLYELIKCFDEDGKIFVTSNPDYNCYSYLNARLFIDNENKLNIEFSNRVAMPSLINKFVSNFLKNFVLESDTVDDIIVRNIDNNKKYNIIGVACDENEDMGNDIYIFINDEKG